MRARASGSAGQRLVEARGQLDDPRPARRRAHHSADRGEAVGGEEARRDAVGGDHEVLDQVLGAVVALLLEVGHLAVDHDRARLPGLEVERPLLVAQAAQAAGGLVLELHLVGDPRHRGHPGRHRPLAFEPGGHRVVSELGAVVDAGLVDVRGGDRAVGGDRHLDHDRQPVLPLVERGDAGRQALGEHGEGVAGGVDRGGVLPRVGVDRRAGVHQILDVRDGHPHLDAAAGELRGDLQLVEVPGVVVVDRGPEEIAEVADGGVAGVEVGRQLRRLGQGRGRKIGLEPMIGHGAAGDGEEVVVPFGLHGGRG